MAKLNWSLCFQRAIVDRNNQLSLIDHLEQIHVQVAETAPEGAITMVPIRCAVVSHWSREQPETAENFVARVRLIDPLGRNPIGGESTIDLGTSQNYRQIFEFPGLPLSISGTYRFEVARKVGEEWINETASPSIDVQVTPVKTVPQTPVLKAKRTPKKARRYAA